MATKNPALASSNPNPFLASARFAANPFEAPAPVDVPADAPEGSYTYALVPSAPALTAEECESAVDAIEIMIRWGDSVLKVDHLTPPRSYYLGEAASKDAPVDFAIPADKLGVARMPLVIANDKGGVRLVVPQNARGTITAPGQKAMSVVDALANGLGQPSAELAGGTEIDFAPGTKAQIEVGGIIFQVGAVNAGKKVAGRIQLDSQSLPFQGVSFLIHAGLLAATALFMPPMAMADEGGVSDDNRYIIQAALDQTAMREIEKKDDALTDQNEKNPGPSGGTGTRAKFEEGKMGSETSTNKNGRYAIKGDTQDKEISRAQAIKDAQDFGMIGILNSGMGATNSPTAPWGAEVAVGNDPSNHLGNMWGANLDDAAGAGGLGLMGIGEGAGGKGEGIGLGNMGYIGNGAGLGDGQGFGDRRGSSRGFLASTHKTTAPRMQALGTVVNGRIPPEVIQRVVRQNFGRFRLCYENGLRNNPNLQGRVAINFVIGRDGSVQQAKNGGSDLPDGNVVSCVSRAFYGLSFPAPDGGIVTVSYPIMFSPGGA